MMSGIETQGDLVMVKPEEDIVASMSQGFKEELESLLENGVRDITIDMTEVEMIDSIGMGLLIATHTKLSKEGGKLKVIHISNDLLSLFETMRLDKHFEVY